MKREWIFKYNRKDGVRETRRFYGDEDELHKVLENIRTVGMIVVCPQ